MTTPSSSSCAVPTFVHRTEPPGNGQLVSAPKASSMIRLTLVPVKSICAGVTPQSAWTEASQQPSTRARRTPGRAIVRVVSARNQARSAAAPGHGRRRRRRDKDRGRATMQASDPRRGRRICRPVSCSWGLSGDTVNTTRRPLILSLRGALARPGLHFRYTCRLAPHEGRDARQTRARDLDRTHVYGPVAGPGACAPLALLR